MLDTDARDGELALSAPVASWLMLPLVAGHLAALPSASAPSNPILSPIPVIASIGGLPDIDLPGAPTGVTATEVLTSIVDDAVTVWCMSTPERFARRGYGRAILADSLLRAKSDGAKVGLLGATPAGKPLYDATGWITLEHWRLFASAESVQFEG